MVQKIITFTGEVQKAGFRERLQDLARGLAITGFVENIIDIREQFPSNETVKVFVQGKARAVDTFVEFGSIKNSLINVHEVDISDLDDDGFDFTDFYIHRDRVEKELGDRLDVGVELLKKILAVQVETLDAIRSGHERIIQNANENTDKIITNSNENTDKIIGRSDGNTGEITSLLDRGFEDLKRHISKENEKWLGPGKD